MRHFLGSLLALSAVLAPTPALAQDRTAQAVAREDFQCTIWLSLISNTLGSVDQDTSTGINVAIGYFVGHYEATSGRTIDDGWDPTAAEEVILNLERFAGICGARMETLGLRMQNLGEEMVEYADRQGGK